MTARHLDHDGAAVASRLGEVGPTSPAATMSVVVPTRDRPHLLGGCLDAVARQQPGRHVEIVVVDDGSRDAAAVAAVVARTAGARLVRGRGDGPAAARNVGVAAATAPVVCFTDDDCRPGPGWLAALAGRFEAGEAVVAGPTRNGRPGDVYATASQAVTEHLTHPAGSARGGRVAFAPTSNVAARADLLRSLPFDETYPLAAGEDRDWCARLAHHGVGIAFEPAAWVAHHQELSFGRFCRQQLRYGRGSAHLRRAAGGRGRGLQPASFYVGLLARGFAHGPRVGALVVLAQLATATGIALETAAGPRS